MYRRGEHGQVARALRVLGELRGFRHGRPLADLAAKVGASERTVKRDLDALDQAGLLIERETRPPEGRVWARLVEDAHTDIAISRRERYTLLAVRSLFTVLRGTPLWEDVESIHRKLDQWMSDKERAEAASLADRFAYIPDGGTKAYDGKEDVQDALLTGVLQRRVVQYAYKDARGRTSRGYLAPLAMVLYKHGLYVVAIRLRRPEDGTAIRADARYETPFAVERFLEAEALRRMTFTPPAGFRLDRAIHPAGGIFLADSTRTQQVVIEFSKSKAAYVLGREHFRDQHAEVLPDGRVRLSFPTPNLTPIVSWVLEWGPHAKVLEPKELVTRVVAELDAARALYA
ncbi:MAG: WYL domain-containing protein [Myxococcales bacterium]|nr:WYL domain-containing protein [Myxococcales bacterium]